MTDRKEYIERGALLQDIEETALFTVRGGEKTPTSEMRGARKVIGRIEAALAADVVEVVRCEKCLFNGYVQSDGVIHCARESVMGTGTVFRKATDYCSYGVRKDGAE